MKTILLCCNAGMSTSILVRKMRKAADDRGVDVKIEAKSLTDAVDEIGRVDCVLLGPQVSYERDNVRKSAGGIPVDVIDMLDYGRMNGEKVLAKAIDLMGGC